jgi:hypothetical protein
MAHLRGEGGDPLDPSAYRRQLEALVPVSWRTVPASDDPADVIAAWATDLEVLDRAGRLIRRQLAERRSFREQVAAEAAGEANVNLRRRLEGDVVHLPIERARRRTEADKERAA